MNKSMWALRVHERGGPERLVYEQAPRPYVGTGNSLVHVYAASFTPTELTWESTWVDHAGDDRRPTIPAHEVSGVVEALGYGAVGVAVGQAVYGLTDWHRDGAAAEYVAVEARNLAPKPTSLSPQPDPLRRNLRRSRRRRAKPVQMPSPRQRKNKRRRKSRTGFASSASSA